MDTANQPTITRLLNGLRQLGNHSFTFEQIIRFVTLSSRLKNDIILVQPADFRVNSGRQPVLPPAVQQFLSRACSIPLELINNVWGIFGQTAWTTDIDHLLPDAQIYEEHGRSLGIGEYIYEVSFNACC